MLLSDRAPSAGTAETRTEGPGPAGWRSRTGHRRLVQEPDQAVHRPARVGAAAGHRPPADGTPHLGTDDRVRHPVGWLRHRLSFWINPDGTRKPTPGEEAAERARLHRQQQADRRAEAARTAAAAASAEAQRAAAATAAGLLAASSPAAAKAMALRNAERQADVPAPRPAASAGRGSVPATAGSAGRPSLASLARELHQLKQAGQLDEHARAAAVGAWEARRAAPETPHDAPGAARPGEQPPAAAAAPLRDGAGGYRPDPDYEAAVAIAVANVAAWEAAQHAGTEGPAGQENPS